MKNRRVLSLAVAVLFALTTLFSVPLTAEPVHAADWLPSMAMDGRVLSNAANTEYPQVVRFGGHDWYVIGYEEGSKAMLFSKDTLGESGFCDYDNTHVIDHNRYADSRLKEYMDNLVASDFSAIDRAAILPRTLTEADEIAGDTVEDALLWPLSETEARSLHKQVRMPVRGDSFSYLSYWLRTPVSDTQADVMYVDQEANVRTEGTNGGNHALRARPAFYLDMNNVLFTSSYSGTGANMGKLSNPAGPDALRKVGATTTQGWKLTVRDPERQFAFVRCTPSENGVTIQYTGAKTGENEYISAVIADSGNGIKYYGRIAEATESTGEVTINLTGKYASGDTVYVFNEQYNGGDKTDYASALLPVNAVVEITDDTDEYNSDGYPVYWYTGDDSAKLHPTVTVKDLDGVDLTQGRAYFLNFTRLGDAGQVDADLNQAGNYVMHVIGVLDYDFIDETRRFEIREPDKLALWFNRNRSADDTESSDAVELYFGQAVPADQVPPYTNEGYRLDGWYLDRACSEGKEIDLTKSISDQIDEKHEDGLIPGKHYNLYAKWVYEHEHDGIYFTPWTSDDSLPTEAGNYYLVNDVQLPYDSQTAQGGWDVPAGEVNLCLNGKTVTVDSRTNIRVKSGATLNLYDEDDTGRIINVTTAGVRERVLVDGGVFNMYGGKITGDRAEGSGVRVSSGTFNMKGGTITRTSWKGKGGVYVTGGTFNMSGGSITDTLSDSTAGGVYLTGGTFNMSGGSITGHTNSMTVSGVYVNGTDAVFNMTGGSIKDNANSNSALYGGGVYLKSGTFNVSGDAEISGNTTGSGSAKKTGNVYLASGKKISVTGEMTGPAIGVTMEDKKGVFTDTAEDDLAFNDIAHFTSDEGYTICKKAADEEDAGQLYIDKKVVLSFDANGAGGTVPAASTCSEGDTATVPGQGELTYTGHTFDGWNTKADGSGTAYEEGDTFAISEDTTLYAQWTAIKYTIKFVDEDGETVLQSSEVAYGDTPVYEGESPVKAATADYRYVFAGWTPKIEAVTGEATYTAAYNAIERTYGEPVWTWTGNDDDGYTAATATFTTNDGAAEMTKEAADEEIDVQTTAATCEEAGKTVYKAYVTFNGTNYTDIREVAIDPAGHEWEFVDFTWTGSDEDGYTAATANYKCTRDAEHTMAVDAVITRTSDGADCETAGTITYTAEVSAADDPNGEERTAVKTVDGMPLGHDWGEPVWYWSEDNGGAVAIFTCRNNALHIAMATDEETVKTVTPATCTEHGAESYTAEVTFNGETYEHAKVITIKPDGHNMTHMPAKAATCKEAGNIEYWHCGTCEKYFSDAEGTAEITQADTVIEQLRHDLVKVPAKKPTHKVIGNIEYYKCSLCGDLFFDAAGNEPATEDDVLLKRGWLLEGTEWHYYDGTGDTDKGTKRCNAWAPDSVGWCWLDEEGYITRDKWIKDNGEWYYLKSNGYMAANEWAKDSKGWMYMNGSGKITKSKWVNSGNQWYYLKANGYMAADEWAKDSKGWLWMESDGKAAKSKWIQYKGSWYYVDASGYMVTGTRKIDGKTYTFDSSGKWIR